MRSLKNNENIHKKEGGSYYVVSANKAGRFSTYISCPFKYVYFKRPKAIYDTVSLHDLPFHQAIYLNAVDLHVMLYPLVPSFPLK